MLSRVTCERNGARRVRRRHISEPSCVTNCSLFSRADVAVSERLGHGQYGISNTRIPRFNPDWTGRDATTFYTLPPRPKYVLNYCGVRSTEAPNRDLPNGNSNAGGASAERPANRGNVPAHPTVLLSLRGGATALDYGMGESRTDRLSVRVGTRDVTYR